MTLAADAGAEMAHPRPGAAGCPCSLKSALGAARSPDERRAALALSVRGVWGGPPLPVLGRSCR
eukprot:7892961-Alexandrium_andersonii.AAC.1